MNTRKKWLFFSAVALLAAIFIVNSGSLNGYFVKDDFTIIAGCYDKGPAYLLSLFFKSWLPEFFPGMREYYENRGTGMIRPIMIVAFKLDYWLYGISPFGYHIFNIVFHFLNAFLLLIIVEFITSEIWLGLIAGMLFALHPAQSSGVAYISGRAEVIAATCYLLVFYLFLRYRATGAKTPYILSLIIFFIGMFSKETSATLPFLIICYDMLPELFTKPIGIRPLLEKAVKKSLSWSGYLGILGVYFIIRKIALGVFLGGYEGYFQLDLSAKLVNVLGYARLALLASPWDFTFHNLSKPTPVILSEILIAIFLLCFFAIPLPFTGIKNLVQARLFSFSILWLIFSSVPAALASTQLSYIFPLYLYLVIVAIACLMTSLLYSIYGKKFGTVLAAVLVIVYGGFQYKYNLDWNQSGEFSRQVVIGVDKVAQDCHKGDTLILIGVPELCNTAWAFTGNLRDPFRKPFMNSEYITDFYIKAFSDVEAKSVIGRYADGKPVAWDSVKRLLEDTPMPRPWMMGVMQDKPMNLNGNVSHAIRVLKWNEQQNILEEAVELGTVMP
ncbi:MAG: hypothetical protein HYR55_18145 [Acidobacteria bacterium]|nr:hypothetical protein [Acidobacteriota bacterium]MBI3655164.1 hypothetical protein [Acidobacteriota bacterium]